MSLLHRNEYHQFPMLRKESSMRHGLRDQEAAGEHNKSSLPQIGTREYIWEMEDQLIMANAYLQIPTEKSSSKLVQELKSRVKEIEKLLGRGKNHTVLSRSRSALQKIRAMEATLSKTCRAYPDCSAEASELRVKISISKEKLSKQKNDGLHLTQIAARTIPKGYHCLSMWLTSDFFTLNPEEHELQLVDNIQNPDYYHYAIFSDNILACAVVVNSTISTSKGVRLQLWKAGILPLDQVVFYNHTDALDRQWHVLGLGEDTSLGRKELEKVAVIHYSGFMKPWLDIAIPKYKGYWNIFLDYDNPYLRKCNIVTT